LDRSVSVAKVTEVMNIARSEKSARSERMDWCISPLY
jgi:hypothetical protein